MTILKRPICWLHGHDWRGWGYGYPTKRSVYQYNECSRCGARKSQKIVGEDENPSRAVRKQRERKPFRGETNE